MTPGIEDAISHISTYPSPVEVRPYTDPLPFYTDRQDIFLFRFGARRVPLLLKFLSITFLGTS